MVSLFHPLRSRRSPRMPGPSPEAFWRIRALLVLSLLPISSSPLRHDFPSATLIPNLLTLHNDQCSTIPAKALQAQQNERHPCKHAAYPPQTSNLPILKRSNATILYISFYFSIKMYLFSALLGAFSTYTTSSTCTLCTP